MQLPPFSPNVLESIAGIIGETASGLSGSQIGRLLEQVGLTDPGPITKRDRLKEAFAQSQSRYGVGTHVAAFIQAVMDPVRFRGALTEFDRYCSELNEALAFAGLQVGEDGKLRIVSVAKTLSEAQERAGRLRGELMRRRVHEDVFRFCREELLQENYFHAVFEATKSVADKIREKSGLTTDGADLVDQALGLGRSGVPLLAFNSLMTDTERNEHTGLMNLLKGMFWAFRNVTAHAPKIKWKIEEQDALDLLTLASLLHRRLDQAVRTRRPNASKA